MINKRLARVDNLSAIRIADSIIRSFFAIPFCKHFGYMLARHAVTDTVDQAMHFDVVLPCSVGRNQLNGDLHLILWRPAGAKIETDQVLGKHSQPLTNHAAEASNRNSVILKNNDTLTLLGCIFHRAPVIPVGAVVFLINQQMSPQRAS
ncbi:Uncharacterised protein [Serratia ficaria]|nr:Uncharacterised protein [Serratia ficaria]